MWNRSNPCQWALRERPQRTPNEAQELFFYPQGKLRLQSRNSIDARSGISAGSWMRARVQSILGSWRSFMRSFLIAAAVFVLSFAAPDTREANAQFVDQCSHCAMKYSNCMNRCRQTRGGVRSYTQQCFSGCYDNRYACRQACRTRYRSDSSQRYERRHQDYGRGPVNR